MSEHALYVGDMETFGYGKELLEAKGYGLEATGTLAHVEQSVDCVLSKTGPEAYSLVVYDLTMFAEPAEEIIRVIQWTKNASHAKVVLAAPGKGRDTPLIAMLLAAGFVNFVLESTYARQQDALKKCINGYFEANAKQVAAELPTEQSKTELHFIAFAGTQKRIGATTQALLYTQYLASLGCRACYVEECRDGYPGLLLDMYRTARQTDGCVVYHGVQMYQVLSLQEMSKMPYDYFVLDMGCIGGAGFDDRLYLSHQVTRVVVAGAKPQEIAYTDKILAAAQYRDAYVIFSFVPDDDVAEIRSMMADRQGRFAIAGYLPDPYDASDLGEGYRAILPVGNNGKRKRKRKQG